MSDNTYTAYRSNLSPIGRVSKRIFDFVIALCGLIVFSPLFLFAYIAIKRDDKGKAIFSQVRIGLGGKPFTIYKFRTMIPQAELGGRPMLWSGDKDPRLTKAGDFLRTHHLDELPQLWNVLIGDMSFVGPRPERQHFIDMIMERNPHYADLYQVRPGVFSEATLYNGYTDSIEKMLKRLDMDLEYMQRQTLLSDFKIVFLTVSSILIGKKF